MNKVKNGKRRTLRKAAGIILAVILLTVVVLLGICMFRERSAVQTAAAYQDTYSDTLITAAEDGGIELLPQNDKSDKAGIIFYVGAQIEPAAYIPLLTRVAEQGYPCFIPNLRFNNALMEPRAAEEIIQTHPEIGSWVLAGHSLGGFTAAGFVVDHPEETDGLILLAAYPDRDMSREAIPALSIYGDTDGVLNMRRYEERLPWYPGDFEEHIIAGANHAQFGDYGMQPKDREALISAEEQQAQTAEIILDWLSRHGLSGEENE